MSASIWYALGDGAADRLRGYVGNYMSIFGDPIADSRRRRRRTSTRPRRCATPSHVCAAAGYDELILVPTTADPDELARTRDALGI